MGVRDLQPGHLPRLGACLIYSLAIFWVSTRASNTALPTVSLHTLLCVSYSCIHNLELAWRIWAKAWPADPIYRHLSSGEVGVFGATIMHSLSFCLCMQGDFPNGFYHSTNAAVKHLVQLWRMKMRHRLTENICVLVCPNEFVKRIQVCREVRR